MDPRCSAPAGCSIRHIDRRFHLTFTDLCVLSAPTGKQLWCQLRFVSCFLWPGASALDPTSRVASEGTFKPRPISHPTRLDCACTLRDTEQDDLANRPGQRSRAMRELQSAVGVAPGAPLDTQSAEDSPTLSVGGESPMHSSVLPLTPHPTKSCLLTFAQTEVSGGARRR